MGGVAIAEGFYLRVVRPYLPPPTDVLRCNVLNFV